MRPVAPTCEETASWVSTLSLLIDGIRQARLDMEPVLNHFDNHTTNGFTEGCNTEIKMLKRISYGLRNVEVCGERCSGVCVIS